MARSTEDIEITLDTAQAAETELTTLNSPSTVSIYSLWKFIFATITNQLEQLWDLKQTELNSVASYISPGSVAWIWKKSFEFQYDATTPQVIVLDDNFVPNYPVIDETKRIITRCQVINGGVFGIYIKAAKSDPPVALSAPELAAFQAYWTDNTVSTSIGLVGGIGFAGNAITVTTAASDKLYVEGTVYYDSQYSSSIDVDVIQALEDYMANLPFGGAIRVTAIYDAIQAVPGVTDVVLDDIGVRADATAWASRTPLVTLAQTVLASLNSPNGYVIQEDTAGKTFTDQLTFTAA